MNSERPRDDATATFIDVLRSLVTHGVDFVVCGGVACVLHGVKRVTNDIDISIKLDDVNLRRLIQFARETRLQPRMPEPLEAVLDSKRRHAWIRDKEAKVFTLVSHDGILQVDVFLEYPIPFDELKTGSHPMTSSDVTFRVSSKQDLIRAKRHVRPVRTVDQRDIEDLQNLIDHERTR